MLTTNTFCMVEQMHRDYSAREDHFPKTSTKTLKIECTQQKMASTENIDASTTMENLAFPS